MKFVVLLTLVAFAASQSSTMIDDAFAAVDANKDGVITQDEIQGYYDRIDSSGNGKLNFSEYKHYLNQTHSNTPENHGVFNYYDKLDGTTDSHVDSNVVPAVFKLLDTDGDSQVTKQEFTAAYPKILAAIQVEINNLETPVGR